MLITGPRNFEKSADEYYSEEYYSEEDEGDYYSEEDEFVDPPQWTTEEFTSPSPSSKITLSVATVVVALFYSLS
jgi:hypothetical protein